MNIEAFTGRAQAYTQARPGYADEALEYIRTLVPTNAVIADVGAGTGIFTALLAQYGYEIFAVEPNADMREQLILNSTLFPNVKIVDGTAEYTTLSENCVDVITNAQSLNRFDLDMFRTECLRIGKSKPFVISIYNDDEIKGDYKGSSRYKKSTATFYQNPDVREFPNPIYFTRDKWLLYFLSMEGVPQELDSGYEAYISELNETFDRDSEDGVLQLNKVTVVYSERIV